MSKRGVEILENPAKKFLMWETLKDEDGKVLDATFTWYNRDNINEKTGKGTNEKVKLPFSFCILDSDWVTFTGYNNDANKYMWANEVQKFSTDTITIKTKGDNNLVAETNDKLFSKDENEYKRVTSFGAKKTISLYVAIKWEENGEFELCNIHMAGACLSGCGEKEDGWWAYIKTFGGEKGIKFFGNYHTVDGFRLAKMKTGGKYAYPDFKLGQEVTKEEDTQLREILSTLNTYHTYYLNKRKEETAVTEASVAE